MKNISFWVSGTPRPKGSWRSVRVKGKTRLIPDNKHSAEWEAKVATAAWAALAGSGHHVGRVAVSMEFIMPRPKSYPKTKARWPHVKPDLDKLVRAVLDAMSGVLYKDDAQVCHLITSKNYGDETGVSVYLLRGIEDDQPAHLSARVGLVNVDWVINLWTPPFIPRKPE